MPTNQEARQASIRAVTGTAYFYNDDWMALFRAAGITSGTYDDRMKAYLNTRMGTSFVNINDAMRAFAITQGFTSWNEMGTFDAAGVALSLPFSTYSTNADLVAKGVTFTRSGLATQYDATGKLTWAPNNLLLNTAALSTQNVTTAASTNYILAFKGTGTVTLSGTSTAGPLVGSGAGTQVYLKISPTAGTLTLTVSGSVTNARLSAVTYETTPRAVDDVETTAAAYYGPRFDFDPVTLAAKGLLIEEARTNITPQSQYAAGWGATGASYGLNNTVAPDGTVTGTILSESSGAGEHSIFQSFPPNVTAGATYTRSVFMKAGTRRYVQALFGVYANGTGVVIDTTTMTIAATGATGTATHTSSSINAVGNGWYRLIVTGTIPGTDGYSILAGVDTPALTATPTSTGSQTWYAWGEQTELGSFATSYIPTSSASVTRAAETASMTGTGLSFYNAAAGTIIAEFEATPSTKGGIWASSTTGAPNLVDNDGGNNVRGSLSGVAYADGGGVATISYTFYKAGFAYSANDFAFAVNGGTVGTSALASTPIAPATLYLGSTNATSDFLNGHIKSLTYYRTRKTNAELQALTQ